ncbi:MAG: TIR domain-containing protein [Clostridiales bacterium]|nr:TIR domain-containing protein [Clostridiales bacterium]
MIDFYNAFISYKHAPLDSKVAEHVQRSLEHFHIPGKIKKKTGKKKIERIFRDKDELPITSDLTDTISNALAKADYLIVICSPNTRQSMWVKREIQYFLRNHTKDKILTVLADGEPEDVIPDELKYDDRVVTNEAGIQYTVKIPIEPLSCDYRMPLNKAKKEELPRLAAAVIGCSYDELVRRQRQYKMRRMALVFAALLVAALAFGGYMMYSRNQIDKAYLESMANQSRYLANESGKMLDDNKRIDALYLALASLPQSDDDPRPVTAEAIQALTQATLAYKGLNGVTINCAWNYSLNSRLKSFKVSPDGKLLAALDGMDVVNVWNTETHEKLCEIVNSDGVKDYMFTQDGTLLIQHFYTLTAYDVEDNNRLWTYDSDEILNSDCICELSDGCIIVCDHAPSLVKLSMENGEEVSRITLPDAPGGNYGSFSYMRVSPDGRKVGIMCSQGTTESYAVTADLATGKTVISRSMTGITRSAEWADNDHFVACVYDMTQLSSSSFGGISILAQENIGIYCLDSNNLSLVWDADFISSAVSDAHCFLPLPERNAVAYFCGNKCCAYDIATGRLMNEWVASETVIDISDRDNDGVPILITTGGALASPVPSLSSSAMSVIYPFAEGMDMATVNSGVYLSSKNSTEILYFNTYVCDEEWTCTDEDMTFRYFEDHMLTDDALVLLTDNDDGALLTLIDPNENEVTHQIQLTEDTFARDYKMIGTDEDTIYLIYSDIGEMSLVEVDISSGDIDKTQFGTRYMITDHIAEFVDGKVVYFNTQSDGTYISIYDTSSERKEDFEVPLNSTDHLIMDPRYFEDAGLIYVSAEEDEYIIDTEDEDAQRVHLPRNWMGTKHIDVSESGDRIVISDGTALLYINRTGNVDMTISCGGKNALGFMFYKADENAAEELIAVFNDGSLIRYNAETGEFISKSEVSAYDNADFDAAFEVDRDSNTLYIQMGQLTDIVDLESWIEFAYIENSFGHHAPTDRFYTFTYKSSSQYHIGYFRHYTLEDLVNKAETILQGPQMPETMRSQYGL